MSLLSPPLPLPFLSELSIAPLSVSMEQTGEEKSQQQKKKPEKKNLIQIPSYQEVFGGSTASTSSYNPSPPASFSEAFSFVKSSEFYSPPPPPAPPPQPETTPRESEAGSASTPSTFASGSGVGQNRNAILVRHRPVGAVS